MLAFGLGSVAVGSAGGRLFSSQLSASHGAPRISARDDSRAERFKALPLARLEREAEQERVFAVRVVSRALADFFEAEIPIKRLSCQVAAPHLEQDHTGAVGSGMVEEGFYQRPS